SLTQADGAGTLFARRAGAFTVGLVVPYRNVRSPPRNLGSDPPLFRPGCVNATQTSLSVAACPGRFSVLPDGLDGRAQAVARPPRPRNADHERSGVEAAQRGR